MVPIKTKNLRRVVEINPVINCPVRALAKAGPKKYKGVKKMLNRRMKLIAVLVLVFVLLMGMVTLGAEPYFKVKLGLFDRLVCLALLPAEGTFATLKIVRDLQMELAPTEEESALAGLIPDLLTGGITVDPEKGWNKVEEKEIIFGEIGKAIIVTALEKLNTEEKLTQQHFMLYELFVVGIKEGDVKE